MSTRIETRLQQALEKYSCYLSGRPLCDEPATGMGATAQVARDALDEFVFFTDHSDLIWSKGHTTKKLDDAAELYSIVRSILVATEGCLDSETREQWEQIMDECGQSWAHTLLHSVRIPALSLDMSLGLLESLPQDTDAMKTLVEGGFISLPALKLALGVSDPRVIQRLFVTSGLKTNKDLITLFTGNSDKSNMIRLVKSHVDDEFERVRDMMDPDTKRRFDVQWEVRDRPDYSLLANFLVVNTEDGPARLTPMDFIASIEQS